MTLVVRVEGLEPPMGRTHQILSLAPIPVRLHPQDGPGRARCKELDVRRAGGSPGTRTRNLLVKSQLLLPIELATRMKD